MKSIKIGILTWLVLIGWVLFILLLAGAARAEMSSAEFFARDRQHNWTGPLVNEVRSPFGTVPRQISKSAPKEKQYVARIVERQVNAKIGSQWRSTAIKLTHIESAFRCSAHGPSVRSHGGDRAIGPLQVMPRTARSMGYDPGRMRRDCEYAIAAGVEHMRRCIASGVRNHQQMAACHVAGFAGWNRRLAYRPERYKQQYIRLAMR